MSDTTLLEVIAGELEAMLDPLKAAANDPERRKRLFKAVGVALDDSQVQALDSRFSNIANAYDGITQLAATQGDPGLDELATTLEVVESLFSALDGIENDLSGIDVEDLGGRLIEYLVLRYLFTERPIALQLATLLSVVELPDPDTVEASAGQLPYPYQLPPETTFQADQAAKLLDHPKREVADAFDLSDVTTTGDVADVERLLFPALTELFGALGFRLAVGRERLDEQDYGGVSGLQICSRSITVVKDLGDVGTLSLWFALGLTDDGLCLAVAPKLAGSLDFEGEGWKAALSLTAGFDVVVLDPDGIVHSEPESGEIEGTASLTKLANEGEDVAFRVGSADGTRLELGEYGFEGSVGAADDRVEVDALASASNANITVAPGDGDGFIQKVLPADGVGVDFDAGLGWSTERGIYFKGGGAGLETELPVNLNIADVLQVETLQLGAGPDLSGESVTIPVHVAADPQVSLGPIDATVEGIGMEAEISFPENQDGNLGPVAVDLGFKPPTGAGMSVDAGVVTGGGFLQFDHENQRYAGTLQLKIGELTITAIGLLTTKLPNGRDGFSLLIIIAGEFPAMQLGFGFTLDGLGGLLGINRSMYVEYLIAGVSDGTVSSIMFPEDPVRNAPQIISDLRNAFPVAPGKHVFGPMGKLGWGTPSMLSASVGVLFELPDPFRIAILGRVHVGLPHEEIGIVVLNMDVFGAVDFGAKIAGAAASLYDSRVLAYTLTGDMAMKTGWGDDPTFVLSVGGFNPRFEPPSDFPSLERIALTLGPGNPQIRWAGYFAVTTNTVQVGARVEVYAAAAGFSFDGKIGFDTLFRFEPFELIADFYAGFALRRGGSKLMSVKVDGTLKGPGPWHVKGKASFEIWPIDFSVNVDKKFGQSKSAGELSPADVFGKVVSALGDERNWSAQRPSGGESIVTLRQTERDGDYVLAHPLGQLTVRQKVSPLGVRIEKYGNGTPASYDKFEISDVEVGGSSEGGDGTREKFGRGEYFELSEAEKLEGPAFESYQAGQHVSNTQYRWGGSSDDGLLARDALDYETAIIDEQVSFKPIAIGRVAMPNSTASAVAAVSAVARGDVRTTGNARYEVTDDETGPTGIDASVSISDASYVVAKASDMTRVDVEGISDDGTTKREAEEALSAYAESEGVDPDDYRVVGAHEANGGGNQ